MRLSIVDANYTKAQYRSLGALWLEWECERRGIELHDPEAADYLLCTVSSQQGISQLRGALMRARNKTAKVIVGGGGAWAPAVFDQVADVVCVGEGARFIETLLVDGYDAACELPESWIPGGVRDVVPYETFPWDMPPLNHPDGTVRVFGSRGCKRRCLFCQTGWESTYRTNPCPERLQAQIDYLNRGGARVALITNDGSDEAVQVRGQQEFLSMSLSGLQGMMPITRGTTKGVRIGVEGVSERLRSAVGKPIDNADLLDVTFGCLANGVGVRWFFIPGLPGEVDADYEDLRQLVRELHRLDKGCVMMNFHSFIPQPATPLSVLPLVDDYWERFDEFRRWFFHGPGFTRRVQIVAPNQYASRIRRAQQSMSATEDELRRGWFDDDNPNWRVKYLAPPSKLRRMARVYADRLNISYSACPVQPLRSVEQRIVRPADRVSGPIPATVGP